MLGFVNIPYAGISFDHDEFIIDSKMEWWL
jgi:hypothetical protein